MRKPDPKIDFTEEFEDENGFYPNMCSVCKTEFYGNKRRTICKACLKTVQAPKDPLREEIDRRIQEHKSDERLSYPDANVMINAPLALIQVDLKARVSELDKLLKWIEEIV